MNLESYIKSFQDCLSEEEAEERLRLYRQRCIKRLINRLTNRQNEWDEAFREILKKSQEQALEFPPEPPRVTFAEKPTICIIDEEPPISSDFDPSDELPPKEERKEEQKPSNEPFPPEARDFFTNSLALQYFIELQQQLEQNRLTLHHVNTDSSLKAFKNDLTLFIRTQINCISNGNLEHLNSKKTLLIRLFSGHSIDFQGRTVSVTRHPQGQLLAMDIAAQTFVTVGTRLVNSVPAIAKSMAIVINGIADNGFPGFRELVIAHIQESCPFLVPVYPEPSDGKFEIEDKYLSRMRSMVLIYTCILVQRDDKGPAWSWLASFLSLKPKPVITATVLQAFLQECSKCLYQIFRKQYVKLLKFIQTDYMKMIEDVTKQAGERQSLIKLSNQLDHDIGLIA